jgi:hypothetical protein
MKKGFTFDFSMVSNLKRFEISRESNLNSISPGLKISIDMADHEKRIYFWFSHGFKSVRIWKIINFWFKVDFFWNDRFQTRTIQSDGRTLDRLQFAVTTPHDIIRATFTVAVWLRQL